MIRVESGGVTPIGTVVSYTLGTVIPEGYLTCSGGYIGAHFYPEFTRLVAGTRRGWEPLAIRLPHYEDGEWLRAGPDVLWSPAEEEILEVGER